ncbi:hypothetical protein AN1233.2 [Aspergillus nidulans FGSC A4]|uniref:Uncharacterized protein n=1 Tax=Emericella nidulans (strain FGSC A4 / ATCC 38163 / CBS 112.46 / NRRL 194 / M139) TaxID=227321 RepID=Q5BDZ7_EMENI|nr:hypothetical protein [Aspergillus nidulans FGSC A4]EAA65826.1 hypothetical protein AN1233.2 [Aspergillus nidulans FGSC A4]CBF87886.1 TPA: conserved hypothetical protein [Aspergillus nidulans FGSC A4]|eukprot:XP_658837.1 hypothetical protein AN1233.2 [Aspergillus nidulans FGSC A4]
MVSAHQHPPPAIPPSPTLSNPDMILPFDDTERENSTPSPPFNLPSLSHLQSFYESRTNHANGYNNLDPTRTSAPRTHKQAFPRHTWMNEGLHDASSRRLSAIGEEDTTSPYRSGRNSQGSAVERHSRVLDSPVSMREKGDFEGAESRAHSSSSSSTISGASETSSWDETKARADYVSAKEIRGSREDRRAAPAPSNSAQSTSNAPAANEKDDPDEDLSAIILESEAERILENAKRRLSLMEGNLTRARSTMRSTTPSLSSSPVPSAPSPGLGQPVGGLYQSIHRAADRRSSNLRPRQTYKSQVTSNNRHSRVYSETNLPSNPRDVGKTMSRSVSAMGSSTSSDFHNDERSFHYAPTRAYLTHRASVSSIQQNHLVPSVKERASSNSPSIEGVEEEEAKISNMEEFNTAYPVHDPPSRSQSQLQVRDLQDQMKGLHIKISTLKVKAQEDGLRRRSLQSLRTPSPLTAANHWPSEALQSSDGAIVAAFELTDHESDHSTAESLYEDAEEDIDREALEEILREPLDDDLADGELESLPAVDDTPHEEREDAFDYEHFILHSALGNYTQTRLRRQSNASETSVETTRPINKRRSMRSIKHSRSNSNNSISTIATFATAAEGRDDIESVLYWDRKFNDEPEDEQTDIDPEPERNPRKSLAVESVASQRPDSAATGSATPTSLASSLVSTVRAAASPHPNSTNSHLGINEDDTRLLEQLFKSLGDVCMNLQELTTSPDYDEKQAKLLRRRLEAARRVLDGELD